MTGVTLKISNEEWNRRRRMLWLDEDMRVSLKINIDKSGLGQNEWARKNKISPQEVSDFLCFRRKLGPKLRKLLKVELVLAYRKIP